MTHIVIRESWTESERGWGQRPDGYSYHVTDADRKEFIADYWSEMPHAVPDEYSRPDKSPQNVVVSNEVYKNIVESKNGIRSYKKLDS